MRFVTWNGLTWLRIRSACGFLGDGDEPSNPVTADVSLLCVGWFVNKHANVFSHQEDYNSPEQNNLHAGHVPAPAPEATDGIPPYFIQISSINTNISSTTSHQITASCRPGKCVATLLTDYTANGMFFVTCVRNYTSALVPDLSYGGDIKILHAKKCVL
jgi:hypothetical protein